MTPELQIYEAILASITKVRDVRDEQYKLLDHEHVDANDSLLDEMARNIAQVISLRSPGWETGVRECIDKLVAAQASGVVPCSWDKAIELLEIRLRNPPRVHTECIRMGGFVLPAPPATTTLTLPDGTVVTLDDVLELREAVQAAKAALRSKRAPGARKRPSATRKRKAGNRKNAQPTRKPRGKARR